MSMNKPCEFSFELAPYILGEIQGEECQRVRQHIEDCDVCSCDIESFSEIISFLEDSSVDRDQSRALGISGASDRCESSMHVGKKAPNIFKVLVPLVGVAALVLGFICGSVYSDFGVVDAKLTRDTQSVGYSSVAFQSKSWGTEMRFSLNKIPNVSEIGAWIKLNNGTRMTICWWPLGSLEHSGTFVASTPLNYAQIKSVGIVTKSNITLWWLQVKNH